MVGMFLFKQKYTIPSMLPSAVHSMNGICCRASFSRPYVDFIHLLMFVMLWNISLQIVLLCRYVTVQPPPPLPLNRDSILDELTIRWKCKHLVFI